jgi:4-hydroxy-tetrahydrodipicolinate synthase
MTEVPYGLMHCPGAPFTADNRLDLNAYEKWIEFCIKHETTSLGVVMHLAESLNLDLSEREELAKASVDFAGGRVPIIVNVSTPGTDHAVHLTRHAEKVGADAVMAIAPYYWKPNQEAVFQHFSAIMAATDLPFIAYHSPILMDGVGVTPALLVRLMEKFGPQFIGLKNASQNFEDFIELRRASRQIRKNFYFFTGTEYCVPAMAMGAIGTMSLLGAVCPLLVNRLFDATVKGDWETARDLQDTVSYLWQIGKVFYPSHIKAMMEIMGRPVGLPRLPLLPATSDEKRFYESELARLGLLDTEPKGW